MTDKLKVIAATLFAMYILFVLLDGAYKIGCIEGALNNELRHRAENATPIGDNVIDLPVKTKAENDKPN